MTITVADLVGLKQQIAADLERLKTEHAAVQAEYDAVELLERRLRSESTQTQLDLKADSPPQILPAASSFAGAVRIAVRHFKDEEFMVKNVEVVLKGMGAQLPAKNCGARIAGELSKLVAQGVIAISRRGYGSSPNRFRLLAGNELESEKNEGTGASTPIPSGLKQKSRGTPMLAA